MKKIKISAISVIIFIVVGTIICKTAAAAELVPVQIKLKNIDKKVKNNKYIQADIVADAGKDNKISGMTVIVDYSESTLEYDAKASAGPSEKCKAMGYKFNQALAAKNDSKKGTISISKVIIDRDENLPSGEFCFGTLVFKTKLNGFWSFLPWINSTATITKAKESDWEIVGPGKKYKLAVDSDSSSGKITITH